ncbi:MAG: hypothetical protein COB66_07040 [Coxiella sp. (in: Bacteria)]|nr:MAG: hypothetical protein COB66_07040 [Coxiella sp. (in: g-proteobacteria)]
MGLKDAFWGGLETLGKPRVLSQVRMPTVVEALAIFGAAWHFCPKGAAVGTDLAENTYYMAPGIHTEATGTWVLEYGTLAIIFTASILTRQLAEGVILGLNSFNPRKKAGAQGAVQLNAEEGAPLMSSTTALVRTQTRSIVNPSTVVGFILRLCMQLAACGAMMSLALVSEIIDTFGAATNLEDAPYTAFVTQWAGPLEYVIPFAMAFCYMAALNIGCLSDDRSTETAFPVTGNWLEKALWLNDPLRQLFVNRGHELVGCVEEVVDPAVGKDKFCLPTCLNK